MNFFIIFQMITNMLIEKYSNYIKLYKVKVSISPLPTNDPLNFISQR